MQFHIRLIDDPASGDARLKGREAHWAYLDEHADHFYGRGPTFLGSMDKFLSTIFFLEFADWQAVKDFIANEPHHRNGVYSEVNIRRWRDDFGRRQRDFPRKEGQVNWYLRGFAKQGMHDRWQELRASHQAYCRQFEAKNFVVRGGIFDEAGENWEGSASLITLPSREAVDAFLHDEPLYKSGLYESFLVEQFKFGGRPGQVT